ncbi:MAG: macro domain-containing protein [Ruminococcaceae bacterium]|nr:macro domain-containing protein [Oscillospiraceae bacterium]
MPLKIIRDDITRVHADAIVNAANFELAQGGGVCGAIFMAAGAADLHRACREAGTCPVGEAVITPAFRLPARFIIHTVGPVWQGGSHGEQALLASCYRTALQLALAYRLKSVAFPLVATGIYGYPKEEALQTAIHEIGSFLLKHDLLVYLVIYDQASFALSQQKTESITAYIDDHYVAAHPDRRSRQNVFGDDILFKVSHTVKEDTADTQTQQPFDQRQQKRRLDDVVNHLDESFSQMLLRLIDKKGYKDAVVYKRANIDRRHFSKIRSKQNYQASKPTALALSIALELSLDETRDLLARAGYALSHSNRFDLIVEYFILEGNYDIFEINQALFSFDQPLLGS